jgi:hypothetical protein
MMNELGHRYRCPRCGSEAIVTRTGDGDLRCCAGEVEDLTTADLEASGQAQDASPRQADGGAGQSPDGSA